MSRRVVTKGTAWAVPSLVVASAAPASAASPVCSASGIAAIDAAFAQVATSLTAYWSVPVVGTLNGVSQVPSFNIQNNTPYAIALSGDQGLAVTFTAVRANGSANVPNGPGSAATSWGATSSVTTTTYNGQNARRWTWTATGTTLRPNTTNSDNNTDMNFSTGTNTGGINVCATLDRAPVLVPQFASIQSQSSAVTPVCRSYYDTKVEAATAATLTFAGPRLGGSGAAWGSDGQMYTLTGGSQVWAVGSTMCSASSGNYVSDTYPPSASGHSAYNYDGIY